jgi:GTP-binding protein
MTREHWRVTEALFERSAPTRAALPAEGLPEFAVAGRSNVGKSSLINALTNSSALARVSRSPGRTQLLNAFTWKLRGPEDAALEARCVDLPGYGFAKVSRDVRESFAEMVEDYLLRRASLRLALLLIDARREFDERDRALVEFLASRPAAVRVMVVGTKADKLGAAARGLWVQQTADAAGIARRDVFLTSTHASIGLFGPRGVLDTIAATLQPT